MESSVGNSSLKTFWRYTIVAAALWSILVLSSLTWNTSLINEQTQQLLHNEALANFNKDQAFRDWGTKHGGLYVPITEETPPSPYMAHIPERDIETPSGKKLTLLNPAYMNRQLMTDYEDAYGIKGKITGLILLRPENAPDEWETEALHTLKGGAEEVLETSNIDGIPHLRIMRPMYMKPGCDKCHGHLGFKTGDFRGGVSISVPATPYINASQEAFVSLATTHLIGWFLGLFGIGVTSRQIFRQISINRKSEAELRHSEHTLSETLRISPNAILTATTDGTITQFNDGASRAFGYSRDEVIGKSVNMLLPEQYRDGHNTRMQGFKDSNESTIAMEARGRISGRRKDGSIFPASAGVSKVIIGDEMFFTVALQDLTEQLQFESQIKEARDLAEVANRTKSEFLANMSHEIRTPLTATKGMLELVNTANLSDEDKRNIQIAHDASGTVITIINDILDLARLEAGHTKLELSVFDLREFLGDVGQLMLTTAQQKGLNLQTNIPGDDPIWIKADIQRLRQILINLIGNAIKFTDIGEVSLNAIVTARDDDETLDIELSVSDSGIGIREDDRARLFERFEQADTTSSRKHQGTGLGLAICSELTLLMKGSISVESTYGQGSTFIININCEAAEPDVSSEEVDETPPLEIAPLHILVAEDNKVNQLLISEFLKRIGHTFDLTSDGKEAVEAWQNAPPEKAYDVILMDVQMPVMDGLEATAFIRNQTERPADIPIIALTADAMTQHQRKYTALGMNGFIGKPYSISQLEAELARVIQEARGLSEQDLATAKKVAF